MRIEVLPLIVGALLALVGLGLVADAWIPEKVAPFRERRRRPRTERDLGGEAMIGIGVLCFAGAIVSRDGWDYVNVAVIAGGVFMLIGVWRNRRYLRDRFVNRGALRRDEEGRARHHEKDVPPPKRRIR